MRSRPSCRAAMSPPRSWARATSPMRRNDAAAPGGGGDAERGGYRAVDPVGAAVGEDAGEGAPGREVQLGVADRHRGGDDERRSAGQRLRQQPAVSGSDSASSSQAIGERRAGRRVGVGPGAEPAGSALAAPAPSVSSAATGSPRSTSLTTAAGSCQAPSGSSASCSAPARRGQPGAQRLGGGQVADADDQVGRDALRRSRGRAAAGRRWRSRCAPWRAPDSGSASSGQPRRSAQRAAASPRPGPRSSRPATMHAARGRGRVRGRWRRGARAAGAAACAAPTGGRRRGPGPGPRGGARRGSAARAGGS